MTLSFISPHPAPLPQLNLRAEQAPVAMATVLALPDSFSLPPSLPLVPILPLPLPLSLAPYIPSLPFFPHPPITPLPAAQHQHPHPASPLPGAGQRPVPPPPLQTAARQTRACPGHGLRSRDFTVCKSFRLDRDTSTCLTGLGAPWECGRRVRSTGWEHSGTPARDKPLSAPTERACEQLWMERLEERGQLRPLPGTS